MAGTTGRVHILICLTSWPALCLNVPFLEITTILSLQAGTRTQAAIRAVARGVARSRFRPPQRSCLPSPRTLALAGGGSSGAVSCSLPRHRNGTRRPAALCEQVPHAGQVPKRLHCGHQRYWTMRSGAPRDRGMTEGGPAHGSDKGAQRPPQEGTAVCSAGLASGAVPGGSPPAQRPQWRGCVQRQQINSTRFGTVRDHSPVQEAAPAFTGFSGKAVCRAPARLRPPAQRAAGDTAGQGRAELLQELLSSLRG